MANKYHIARHEFVRLQQRLLTIAEIDSNCKKKTEKRAKFIYIIITSTSLSFVTL